MQPGSSLNLFLKVLNCFPVKAVPLAGWSGSGTSMTCPFAYSTLAITFPLLSCPSKVCSLAAVQLPMGDKAAVFDIRCCMPGKGCRMQSLVQFPQPNKQE